MKDPTPLLGLIELSARIHACQVGLAFGTVHPDIKVVASGKKKNSLQKQSELCSVLAVAGFFFFHDQTSESPSGCNKHARGRRALAGCAGWSVSEPEKHNRQANSGVGVLPLAPIGASIGSIIGMFRNASVNGQAGYDATKAEDSANWVEALSGAGFSLNFTSKGVTGTIGQMSGFDLSANIASIVDGLSVRDFALSELAAGRIKQKNYEAMNMAYAHGDFALLDTLRRTAAGKDHISFSEATGESDEQNRYGLTTSSETGRNIAIDGSKSAAEIAVMLGHEAWRNGIDDGEDGQKLETRDAVLAHTILARTLMGAYGAEILGGNSRMAQEVALLNQFGAGALGNYADAGYDSSSDYWRLTRDGKLLFDKEAKLTVENPDGTTAVKEFEKGVGVESALMKILGVTQAEAQNIMANQMGLEHSDGAAKDWDWNKKATGEKITVNGKEVNETFGDRNLGKGVYLFDSANNVNWLGKIDEKMFKAMGSNLIYNYGGEQEAISTSRFVDYFQGDILKRTDPYKTSGYSLNNMGRYDLLKGTIDAFAMQLMDKNALPFAFASLLSDEDGKSSVHISQYAFETDPMYATTANPNGYYVGGDYAAPEGTPAYSVFPGIVNDVYDNVRTETTKTLWESNQNNLLYKKIEGKYYLDSNSLNDSTKESYGNALVLDIGYNFENSFISTGLMQRTGHYQIPTGYKIGDQILPGEVLGLIGSTGKSEAPHQHNELLFKDGYTATPNAWLSYLGFNSTNLSTVTTARRYGSIMDYYERRYSDDTLKNLWKKNVLK